MAAPKLHGVLVVDKPSGMTSHDVVRAVRRALQTRAVGHAGTLDPMATGVLVIGIGEGTKLLHHLSADDKTYLATISLGIETDTLDADGIPVEHAALPARVDRESVELAARTFLGETVQVVPKVSAIKRDGVALHERVRRGEVVDPPSRNVIVHELEVLDVRAAQVDLRVRSGKGFYVRSLARDLAIALGTRGHLSALRRVASGAYTIIDAVDFELIENARRDPDVALVLRGRLLQLAAAMRGVPLVTVDAAGVEDVRQGRALVLERLTAGELPGDGVEPVGILDAAGTLIALGRSRTGRLEIMRGILTDAAPQDP